MKYEKAVAEVIEFREIEWTMTSGQCTSVQVLIDYFYGEVTCKDVQYYARKTIDAGEVDVYNCYDVTPNIGDIRVLLN